MQCLPTTKEYERHLRGESQAQANPDNSSRMHEHQEASFSAAFPVSSYSLIPVLFLFWGLRENLTQMIKHFLTE